MGEGDSDQVTEELYCLRDGFTDDGFADYLYETLTTVIKGTAASLSKKTEKFSVRVNVLWKGLPTTFKTVVEVEQMANLCEKDTWLNFTKVPNKSQHVRHEKAVSEELSEVEDKEEEVGLVPIERKPSIAKGKKARSRLVLSTLTRKGMNKRKKNKSVLVQDRTKIEVATEVAQLAGDDFLLDPETTIEPLKGDAKPTKEKRPKKSRLGRIADGISRSSAVNYIKENYISPFDQPEDVDSDVNFADFEIIVEETDVEDSESRISRQPTNSKRFLKRRKKDLSKAKKPKNFDSNDIASFFPDNEKGNPSSSFEFSTLDVVKSMDEDKLLQQKVLSRQLSPREAELALYYGGVTVNALNKGKGKGPRFGAALRRRVKLKSKSSHVFNEAEVRTKDLGLNVKPQFLFLYLVLPMFLLSLNYLIPWLYYYLNIITSPDKFDEFFTPHNGYSLPAIVKVLLPVEFHDILNRPLFTGGYMMRVGGLLIALKYVKRFHTIFSLVRPKPLLVERKATEVDERHSYKFLMKLGDGPSNFDSIANASQN